MWVIDGGSDLRSRLTNATFQVQQAEIVKAFVAENQQEQLIAYILSQYYSALRQVKADEQKNQIAHCKFLVSWVATVMAFTALALQILGK